MNKTLISFGVLVVVMGYVVCAYAGRNAVNGFWDSPTQATPLITHSATQPIHLVGGFTMIWSKQCDFECQAWQKQMYQQREGKRAYGAATAAHNARTPLTHEEELYLWLLSQRAKAWEAAVTQQREILSYDHIHHHFGRRPPM